MIRQHARDGGLGWSQCEQIVFEIERKLKHTESGYPTLSNTPRPIEVLLSDDNILKTKALRTPGLSSDDSPALSWSC